MNRHLRLKLKDNADTDAAWAECLQQGIENLYFIQDDDGTQLFGELSIEISLPALFSRLPSISSLEAIPSPSIDWQAQWETFGLNYFDGHVHADLSKMTGKKSAPTIILKPGPGFGDLSHPTTCLMLEFMGELTGHTVCDIGCGSGVLSIAAAALRAKKVFGIDIDIQALKHAHENALLNAVEEQISFYTPQQYQTDACIRNLRPDLILMNIIPEEQLIAWSSLPALHSLGSEIIVSGILETKRKLYINEWERRGWLFLEEKEKEGWLAFRFKNHNVQSTEFPVSLN